ncbi:potassium channel family protein [Halococcus thailandensis]|uniref:Trk active potasium channel n=1 Tax=Halococcus thailandensis JCM 13552 TaxID=1227457 RepID=M0N080_9EURY|nr:NAD-binding protein [Halococcus thailandensis]EMA51402.1 trk active potasium channel [Halococcus thailandensis JCM 13552]
MSEWRRRTGYSIAVLVILMIAYAIAYYYGMSVFEGEPKTFLHSLQVVIEAFTTTGFGSDSPWTSPAMNVLVIAMDLTGVALIFLALPVVVFPLIEESFSTSAPSSVTLTDHIVICAYTPRGEMFIEELTSRGIPYFVLVADRDRADDLHEDGVMVVHGDPESPDALARVNLADARALVADASDEENASIVLAAAESDTRVLTFVENTGAADYHRYAGADDVFSPRRLVGESLANKVTTAVSTELGDAIEIDPTFEIVELPVQSGSDLAGTTIADSAITERTGANVIGAWLRGEFVSPPAPDTRLDEHSLLLVAGRESQLERLKEMTMLETRPRRRGRVIVAGLGEVGSTVAKTVETDGLETVTVDIEDRSDVDVVGDVTEESTLREAGIEEASAVILALPDDTQTVFATLVIRELSPDVEVLARSKETASVRKLYRAGADYVLALAIVSGRMLASTILDEEVMGFDKQIEVVKTRCSGLDGRTLREADIRARTGCTVVAVERDGTTVTDVGPDFEVRASDKLIVVGTDVAMNHFAASFELASPP